MVAKELSKSRNPRDRQLARLLARGRVRPGSDLDFIIKMATSLSKEGDGGMSGPGSPTVGVDVHTDTAGGGKASRKSRLQYDGQDGS